MTRPWKMPLAAGALALVFALGTFGCTATPSQESGSAESTVDTPADTPASPEADMVQSAAKIATEIEAEPDRAAAILESHGMTPEQFQALMYEIAQDPAKSEAYAAARAGGGS